MDHWSDILKRKNVVLVILGLLLVKMKALLITSNGLTLLQFPLIKLLVLLMLLSLTFLLAFLPCLALL